MAVEGCEYWARLIKFFGSFVPFIMFTVAFGQKAWLETDTYNVGLWSYCPKNHNESVPPCHNISPGDSSTYYEVVRTLSAFVLVCYILQMFTCDENNGLGRDSKPFVLTSVTVMLLTIVLAVLGACYEDDDTWANDNVQLDWGFFVAAAADGMSLLTAVACLYLYRKANPSAAKKSQVKPNPQVKKADPKPNAQVKKADPKPKPEPKPEPNPPKPIPPAPPSAPQAERPGTAKSESSVIMMRTEGEKGDSGGKRANLLPPLPLSTYDLPAEPGSSPFPPPTDYLVTTEGKEGKEAPRVTLQANSRWKRGIRFLSNYFKAGIGIKPKNKDTESV